MTMENYFYRILDLIDEKYSNLKIDESKRKDFLIDLAKECKAKFRGIKYIYFCNKNKRICLFDRNGKAYIGFYFDGDEIRTEGYSLNKDSKDNLITEDMSLVFGYRTAKNKDSI